MPGAGKDTIAQIIAKKFKLKQYSVGGFRRKMAEERGMTLAEFNKLGETQDFTDKQADAWQKKIGETEDNFIIDGRTSFYFIPDSIKIFLAVSPEQGAARILSAKRENEKVKDKKEAIKMWHQRMDSDTKRYKNLYNFNPFDKKYYDFYLDTSNLSIEEVFAKVYDFIKSKK